MSHIRWIRLVVALLAVSGLRPSHGAPVESTLDVSKMEISCKVTSRFARTLIMTEILNTGNDSQEAIFDVELPKTAFITNFNITVDGVTNVGVVKKKEDASEQYDRAVSRGESAGLVQSMGRKMENFKISVNVGARSAAIFKLTYEELLKRQHGIYEMQIKVRPKQLVENFQINVDILEPQEISFVQAYGTFTTNDLQDVIGISHSGNKAHITFTPSVQQQKTCSVCSETLLDGDFIIKYDVKRDTSAGNIQIVNGYFVHYFAPSSLARLPKNVVFVIDCSGSMRGRKLEQTFEALTKILEALPEEDHVGILKFNEDVSEWKPNLVKATPDNIKSAKEFVEKITARGVTNINSALLAAAKMLQKDRKNKVLPEISASLIVFLSDGDPTAGVTDLGTIIKNVKAATEEVATLYSLGFGYDVDFSFLEKMSLENGGLARRIYEDSDSALQLQNFYKEVAFPVLLGVTIQYADLPVNHLTQNSFNHYYQGSELIVAGHVDDNDIDVLAASVTAQGASEPFSMKVETNMKDDGEIAGEQRYAFGDFTERLWAYLTIEQLLTKQISAKGEEEKNITEEALRLCLKYSFVTPLTSMVITNPEDDDDRRRVVANKPNEDDDKDDPSVRSHSIIPLSGAVPRSGSSKLLFRGVDALRTPGSPHARKSRISKKGRTANVTPLSDNLIRLPKRLRTITAPEKDSAHVALITVTFPPNKILLGIDETQDVWINLLHNPDQDITLNGKLSADDHGFSQLGYMNRKKKLSLHITPDNITLFTEQSSQTFNWSSAMQGVRSVRKEARKIALSVESGFRAIVLLKKNPERLTLHVESKKQDCDFMGLIGQLMTEDHINVDSAEMTVLGESYPAESSPDCNLSSYNVKQPESCTRVILPSSNTFARISYRVPGIFDIPPDP